MDETELAVLFKRFSQASVKTHTVFGGSGLGLFICRMLTERMGGRIDVTSTPGQGAQFHFFIKTRPCLTCDGPDSKNGLSNAAISRDGMLKSAYRPHVLIVEDNLINRKILLRQLLHVGLTAESERYGQCKLTSAVSNGLEAVERLRRSRYPKGSSSDGAASEDPLRPFQCVLMDLDMPVMDGYEAAELIRKEEEAGVIIPTVIIALSESLVPERWLMDQPAMPGKLACPRR